MNPYRLYLLVYVCCCWHHIVVAQQPSADSVWLSGKVIDSATKAPLPARIVLLDSAGVAISSFYQKLPGFFTRQDGTFRVKLKPGNYTLKVYRGIDYLSSSTSLTVSHTENASVLARLQRWYPLREKGWVNGDGHDHLYTDVKNDSLMLDTVRTVCVAQGIDFMCAAQGWAGYTDSNWREGYAKFSDEKFLLHYGSEMPKYRTGHTWWIGQNSTRGIYWNTMDTTYENHYYQSEQGTSWTFDSLRFPQVPDVEVVQRIRRADDAVAVVAHPTSWWWQQRGQVEKYVTNVAAYIPFGLLAGKLWEGQVIMGYDRDHYYYQNLWFHVLNEGYRMTPLSELDGGYNRGDKFYYGSMRTYYKVDGPVSIEKIKAAVRKGHTFVTSGPIVFADIDGRYNVGDVVPANGKAHTLNIEARSSGDQEDYISYVVLFRNGKINRLWDLRQEKKRKFNDSVVLNDRENSWYVVKVYGKRAWQDPANLDVMTYCANGPRSSRDSIATESDVAITSPFYFRKNQVTEPPVLMSKMRLKIRTAAGTVPEGLKIDLLVNGERLRTIHPRNGNIEFDMPVHSVLRITAGQGQPVYRCLYLDYLPFRNILETIASGRWQQRFPARKYHPGEIPWEAFRFREIRTLLSDVSWNVEYSPNERDPLWEPLEAVFREK